MQQVWLQKLGGAINPVRKFKTDIIKEDQPQIQKPVSELDSTKPKVRLEEKLTPEGLRPGERFKQIKEQEMKRERRKEEEKRKAEEAAAKRSETKYEGLEKESDSFDRGTGTSPAGADVVVDTSTMHDSSTLGTTDGNLSGHDVKDGNSISIVEISDVSATPERQKL